MAKTLAVMRSEVTTVLGADNTIAGDQTLIDMWINDGVKDIVRRSKCNVAPFSIALTSGQAKQDFPTTIVALMTIRNTSASGNNRMIPMTLAEIEDMHGRVASASAPARHYAIQSDFLYLYPTPGAGETIVGIYVPGPATLSQVADTPLEIPGDFHDLPVLYAEARVAEYLNHLPSNNGVLYRGYYEQRLRELKTAMKKMAGPVLPRKTLNAARRLYPARDNSADW